MAALLDVYFNEFLLFVMVLTRLAGLFLASPLLGLSAIPVQVRALAGIGIALMITPVYRNVDLPPSPNVLIFGVTAAAEFLLGLTLGLGVRILLSGLQLTGIVSGQMAGLALASEFDSNVGDESSVFAQLLWLVTMAIFVVIGGHRIVMQALLDTFQWYPPGHACLVPATAETLVDIVAHSFVLGMQAGAPMIVALLLAILITGLIGRTLPQLNILAVGFSINALVMLGTLSITIGAAAWVFQDQVEPTVARLLDLFRP